MPTWPAVERVAIVGCGGSGKTHLARDLARRLGLPLTHLDAIYYDAKWDALSREAFVEAQLRLVAEPRWIIEGNYASTLAVRLVAADSVIVMDLPARSCLLGVLQRRLLHRGGQHQELGVYDRITWSFIKYIVGYRREMLPRVRGLIRRHAPGATVVVLRSRREARRFLQGAGGVAVRCPSAFEPEVGRC
jgi:adenylate kinase family enzyme